MNITMQDYVAERSELIAGQVRKIRENSVETVREAVVRARPKPSRR